MSDILIQELQKSLNSESPVLLIDVRTHKELNEVGQVGMEALPTKINMHHARYFRAEIGWCSCFLPISNNSARVGYYDLLHTDSGQRIRTSTRTPRGLARP